MQTTRGCKIWNFTNTEKPVKLGGATSAAGLITFPGLQKKAFNLASSGGKWKQMISWGVGAALTTSESLLTCWNIKEAKTIPGIRTDGSAMLESPPWWRDRRRGVAELQVRCAFPAQPAPHDANGRAWLKESFPPSCRFSPPLPSSRLPPRGCALNGTLRHNLQLFCVCVFPAGR